MLYINLNNTCYSQGYFISLLSQVPCYIFTTCFYMYLLVCVVIKWLAFCTANREARFQFNLHQGRNWVRDFYSTCVSQPFGYNEFINLHCRCENHTVREKSGHPPSYYAEDKKGALANLRTHGCLSSQLQAHPFVLLLSCFTNRVPYLLLFCLFFRTP